MNCNCIVINRKAVGVVKKRTRLPAAAVPFPL
jgi:hypothetical protein